MATEKKRMEWLDAMRGFTMILVVAYHVLNVSYGINCKASICQNFFMLFRMPLFFFVSGFLAYKASNIWTGSLFWSQLKKKLKVQIIPALIFFCIFILLFFKDIPSAFIEKLESPHKGGYWFTWVLLHMFIIYYLLEYLAEKSKSWRLKLNMNITLGITWFIFLAGYAVLYMPPVMALIGEDVKYFLDCSSLIKTIELFQFFILGNLVHRNWSWVQRMMDSKWFFPLIVLVALITCSDFLVWHNLKFMWRNLPRTIAMYSLLMIVVCFFRHYENWFTKDTKVGRSMQHIGTRTLDIYLLHVLFLPQIPAIGKWLNGVGNSFILELTSGVGMALLVIGFCLIVSNLLRISPFLSRLLFGRG